MLEKNELEDQSDHSDNDHGEEQVSKRKISKTPSSHGPSRYPTGPGRDVRTALGGKMSGRGVFCYARGTSARARNELKPRLLLHRCDSESIRFCRNGIAVTKSGLILTCGSGPSMSVQLLPQDAARDTDSEPGDSRENSRGEHNPEEIPQPARKAARVELFGQQSPGEWSGADEPDEERDIR